MIILKQGVQEKEKIEPNLESEKQVKKVIGIHYKID
jgi:hypothetical protein